MDKWYPTRLQGRQVRLLELNPGFGSEPVQCSLWHDSLDDLPPFEALSYVWGNPTIKNELNCNGNTFMVTENLHHALRRLRLVSEKRLVWVDAICINQNDIIERAQQVQIMGDVYRIASRVVAYLGIGGDEEVLLALSTANVIFDKCDDYASSQGKDVVEMAVESRPFESVKPHELNEVVVEKHPGLEPWKALAALFARPWFTRVWCVQEILLAQDSVVLVGQHSVPWKTLGVCAAWLSGQDIASDFDMPTYLRHIPYNNCFSMFDEVDRDDDPSVTLISILRRFYDFKATDPRDKVYGFLGVAAPPGATQPLIEVDYRKSFANVHIDVVDACLRGGIGLSILSYVKNEHKLEENADLPTWVPVWEGTSEAMTLGSLPSFWEACGTDYGVPDVKLPLSHIMTARGIIFDEVQSLRPAMDVTIFQDEGEKANGHPFIDLWHEVSAGDESAIRVIKMALTLAAGLTSDFDYVDFLENHEREQFYTNYLAYISHLLHSAGQKSETFDPEDLALSEEHDWSSFRIAASRACDERRVFQVSGGQFGLGPACMAESDIVIVLYGGIVPFVLRPCQDGEFLFVGECYMCEIMQGEAFDEVYLGKPVPEARSFSLK
ncbi:Fc.00g002370.m01.CDS01 [Cosmosporella sp. VM-42]